MVSSSRIEYQGASGIAFHEFTSLVTDCDETLLYVMHRRPWRIVVDAVLDELPQLVWHVRRLRQARQSHSDPGQCLREVFEVVERLLLRIKLTQMVSKCSISEFSIGQLTSYISMPNMCTS